MRNIGFSTGAIALENFRKGIEVLRGLKVTAVELSALREVEVEPLVEAIDALDLSSFTYISVHAPSKYSRDNEADIIRSLKVFTEREWYVILHPDAIYDYAKWKCLGKFLCIENMDKRKKKGRTLRELENVFLTLPDASFCFDIGHARQVDPTMTEAYRMLSTYRDRLVQVHMSEVNSQSKHDIITFDSFLAFRKVRSMIPANVPIIMETHISQAEDAVAEEARNEIEKAEKVFAASTSPTQTLMPSRVMNLRYSLRTLFRRVFPLRKLPQ